MSIHEATRQIIEEILRVEFSPLCLDVVDDSAAHAGHAAAVLAPKAGHFKVKMTSAAFNGQNAVKRHRMVYEKLGQLMDSRIHALSLTLLDEQEK